MAGFLSRLFGRTEPAPDPKAGSPTAFTPLNPLERLLMAAATDSNARAAFLDALLETPLLVATPDVPRDESEVTVAKGETLSIMTAPVAGGGRIPAIFSAQQRLVDCFGPDTGYAAIEGRGLLETVASDGAVLNPGSAYGVHWTADDLAAILNQPVRRTLDRDTQVMLGSPSERPEALIAALTSALDQDPRVERAWLALAAWPDSQEQSWYLDIHADADADAILPGLSAAMTPGNLVGRAIDVVVHPVGSPEGAGIRLKPAILL